MSNWLSEPGTVSSKVNFGLARQDLLETQMGMRLGEMQQVAQLSPEGRQGVTLPQAHLPARGFYNISSSTAARSQKRPAPWFRLFGVPGWSMPWLASQHKAVGGQCELATASCEDQVVVVDPQAGEL